MYSMTYSEKIIKRTLFVPGELTELQRRPMETRIKDVTEFTS